MVTASPLPETLGVRLARHWRALFHLAWPVVFNRAGLVVMAFADVVMTGRYDTAALAALSLGYAVTMPIYVTGIGCMTGIIATTAREHGSGSADAPAIAFRGLWWASAIGIVAALLCLLAGPILELVGQAPDLVTGGAAVALLLAPGTFFQIVFVAAGFYLEGTGRTRPGLVAMIGGNVLNVVLNWMMIGGHLGAPAMGAEGAALATTIARAAMLAGLLAWMLRLPELAPWRGTLRLWGPGGWAAGAEMRRIGFAGGAAYFFETVAFATLAQAAGLLGATALAAYTILHNIEAMVFMVALGVSVASAVMVGRSAGVGDRGEARFSGLAGLAAAMCLVGVLGLVLLAAAPAVVGFYSDDASLVARAAPIMAILAVSMIFDAGQVVLGQATRALGDSWGTTLCFFIAFFCVMLPVGLILAFHTPLAEAGLFIGTALGCFTAVVLLGRRFLGLAARI
jgi:multidrug resistance protein, MATE family